MMSPRRLGTASGRRNDSLCRLSIGRESITMSADSTTAMRGTVAASVVLLSGGLDSTTTLAIARSRGFACHALSVDYGQRHRIELDRAAEIAKTLGAVEHRIIKMDLRAIGGSAL